jgi:hypothetical protein
LFHFTPYSFSLIPPFTNSPLQGHWFLSQPRSQSSLPLTLLYSPRCIHLTRRQCATGSSKMTLPIYRTTQHHIPNTAVLILLTIMKTSDHLIVHYSMHM